MQRLARSIEAVFVLAVLLVLTAATASLALASNDSAADLVPVDDYPVYNAVLANIDFSRIKPENEIHALIVVDTLNLGCGAESQNPILFNKCSPMLIPPATTQDVHALLKDAFRFQQTTWADLLNKNAKTWRLQDQFKTPWKHGLTGTGLDPKSLPSPEWDRPDCAFYFSRIGFDEERKEAIVFVLLASYMDQAPSSGDYFLLHQHQNAEWTVDGRANAFSSDENSSEN